MPIALLRALTRTFSTTSSARRNDQLVSSRLKPDIDVQPLDLKKYKPGSIIARGPDEVKAKILELIPLGKAILVDKIFHNHQSSPRYYKKENGEVYEWNNNWDQESDPWIKVVFNQFAFLQVSCYLKSRGCSSYGLEFCNSFIGARPKRRK